MLSEANYLTFGLNHHLSASQLRLLGECVYVQACMNLLVGMSVKVLGRMCICAGSHESAGRPIQ